MDAQGRYVYSSPAVTNILGYAPGEILGKMPHEIAGREIPELKFLLQLRMGRKKPFQGVEITLPDKEGEIVILETSGGPIFDEKGNFLTFYETINFN